MADLQSTYRIQLHRHFGFDQAAAIVPYLRELGVSHLYCSPYTQARKGSDHGYDVVDPSSLNEELGGEQAHGRLCRALHGNGMKHIVDIVPNHMATNDARNRWWWDVLSKGRSSRYASYFDIDWDPPEDKLARKILLPVLADHYGRVLEAGELRIVERDGSPLLCYYDLELPLAEESIATSLDVAGVNSNSRSLHELLEAQHYRLAFWRTAFDDLNYRRFFSINDLVGLRMENDAAFEDAHALVFEMVADGRLDGVRVDHVDGLADPENYLRRLRARLGDRYIVVEKILEPDEELPPSWPVQGTTGYDFLARCGSLFVDSRSEGAFSELYSTFVGPGLEDYSRLRHDKKVLMAETELAADVERLTALLSDICERHLEHRDWVRHELRTAINEVAATLSVYRTYARPNGEVSEHDRAVIDEAVNDASARIEELRRLFTFIGELLDRKHEGRAEVAFATRFQQLSGAVMAKGVEDTLFYSYNRLSALNEVGDDPGTFGNDPKHFHAHNTRNQALWPATMLATSTHDTKRSEEVRARLYLLSEIPAQWSATLHRLSTLGEQHRSGDLPGRNMEYLLYQTLVGAWPLEPDRAVSFVTKASKEAKERTSWIAPDAAYDEALRTFVQGVLSDPDFIAEIEEFVSPLIEPGWVTSLSQTLLKLASPGIPDIYQGCELWNFSLVDPDNRRPVDFEMRAAMLSELRAATPEQAWARAAEGAPKLFLVQRTLDLRNRLPTAFGPQSTYDVLEAAGSKAQHAVAFCRGGRVTAVAPRLVLSRGAWEDTSLRLPEGSWRNVLAGDELIGEIEMDELLARFPVALLERTDA